MVKMYLVGGAVRDSILGVPTKDFDYSVEASSFEEMRSYILSNGGKIYLEKPEYLTIRGKFNGRDADYVLCRKEGKYTDGRRPDEVIPGTIFDDLARRDFSVNAIAYDEDSQSYIDPHNGIQDLRTMTLRCVGNPIDRFNEDSLRIMRAIRFSITKGFAMDSSVANALWNPDVVKKLANVSKERIREELLRCFKHSTLKTIATLEYYPMVRDVVFDDNALWLKPTMEE